MMKVEDATLEDLERKRVEFEEERASIQCCIEMTKTEILKKTQFIDRLKKAFADKGRKLNSVQRELSRREKEERQARYEVVAHLFVQAARKRLEPDVFASIMAEATDTANYVVPQ